MTTVIGLTPDERGREAVALGAMLARSNGDDLVVAVVVPSPWPPNPYRPDSEYLALQDEAAERALDQARAQLGPDLHAEYVLHRARSVSSGLVEVAERSGGTQIVLGSASTGLLGQVTLGGIADRIMHSSELPVALAPGGFASGPTETVQRVTVGFGRADRDSNLLATVSGVAESVRADLRVACFAVRPLSASVGTIEPDAERLVVDSWTRYLDEEVAAALEGSRSGSVATKAQTVVGQGGSWAEAIADVPWAAGDVLVIGASSSPISAFFLGTHAAKILRNATVPVFLVPRSLVHA
ncbi:MAG TPA: universal stress protein [Propionibacteriaceae bacterium]